MVEAPGTAPGSNGFITMAIYRHSRCRHPNIGTGGGGCKSVSSAMPILVKF